MIGKMLDYIRYNILNLDKDQDWENNNYYPNKPFGIGYDIVDSITTVILLIVFSFAWTLTGLSTDTSALFGVFTLLTFNYSYWYMRYNKSIYPLFSLICVLGAFTVLYPVNYSTNYNTVIIILFTLLNSVMIYIASYYWSDFIFNFFNKGESQKQ